MTKLNNGLVEVVQESYERSFTIQSDFARAKAEYVAMAASLGLLTTRLTKDVFSRHWRPTIKGLMFLESLKLTDDEPSETLDDVSLFNSIAED